MNARNTAGGTALRNSKRQRDKGKNMPNKKEDSRAMSRWAEANRCSIGCISITRRPGSKGTKTISRKSRHRPFYMFWSAILDQRRFYYVLWYSVGSAASCISSPSLFDRIRVVTIAYFPCRVCVRRMAREVCKKRVVDAGEEGGEVERGWRGNGAREDARGMSDDKKEYDPIWARARRHSDGRERTLLIYYLITDLLPGRAIGDATTCTGTPDVDLPV